MEKFLLDALAHVCLSMSYLLNRQSYHTNYLSNFIFSKHNIKILIIYLLLDFV